jgi:hypothetical protein
MQNRAAALDSANKARTIYESILQSTTDPQLIDRAQFGLGRVYELRNELDKAREHYLAVKGGFADAAKQRADKLTAKDSKDVFDWLATAQAPHRTAPTGAGTPGQKPEFTAGELEMPSVEGDKGLPAETPAPSGEDLLKGMMNDSDVNKDTKDRYQPSGEAPKPDASKK